MNYAEFAYAAGTISSQALRDISFTQFDALTAIKNQDWIRANDLIELVQVQVTKASNGISLYDYTSYISDSQLQENNKSEISNEKLQRNGEKNNVGNEQNNGFLEK